MTPELPLGFDDEPDSNLTPEQRAALAVREASVALSAGAGCGKTTVLTERFVRALDGPCPVPLGRVVALTFTNKAARELRDRIRGACRARLEAGGDPTYWRGVVRGLEAARISTFHAFCTEVLRRHAVEVGVDPGFVVLDEPVAAALRDEALSVALRAALAHRDEDLIELAVDFGLGAVRQALGDLLKNRSAGDVAAWADREPGELIGVWLDRWNATVRPALVDRVRTACQPVLGLAGSVDFGNAKVRARLDDFADAAGRLDGVGAGDPVPAVLAVAEAAKVVGLVGKLWPSVEVYEAVKAHFEAIRDAAKGAAKGAAWDEATSRAAAVHGLRFARLAGRARESYDRLKRLRGGVDTDDLLLLTRRLLDESAAARDALAGSVDLVLVDEFQDTDPIQGEILNRVVGADEAGAGRLFLVGDFKQSIYRFRGADPELFRAFRAAVPEAGRRDLTENFRSVPGVLDFVNALFADSLAAEAGAALRPGGGGVHDPAGPPAVLFSWAGPPPAHPAGGKPAPVDATARRVDEARRLAGYLADRLGRGDWTVRNRDGSTRPAHAGDVAILFRSLGDSSYYEQELVAAGLDFHVVGGSGFFAQQEVLDLINVLAAVEDPTDGIALAGALRSPFFAVGDDALYWVAVECPGALHAGLDRMAGEKLLRLPEADRPRVDRARQLLADWRAAKDAAPIAATVDRILGESGYEAALLGEALGDRKRANARKLVRMARRLDEAGGFTLADFVDRLRNDLRAATKENQAATTDDAGRIVRLMSIHQAKGLEFPIVVVPDLDRKRPGELKRVAFDPDLGPLVNPVADADDGSGDGDDPGGCLGWAVYRHRNQVADDAEALRLLYVATTRARDYLILSAAGEPTAKPTSPTMTLLDRRFDRATGRLKGPLPEGWPAPRVEVIAHDRAESAIGRGRPARPKLPLLEVAEAIRAAQLRPEPAGQRHEPRPLPRFAALDPASGLTSTAARLDRLMRAILQDPRGFDPEATAEVARRAALLGDSIPAPSLVDQAVARVRAWLARLPDELDAEQAERSGRWDWATPIARSGIPTVFAGWGDFAFRHPDGSVAVVVIGDGRTCQAAAELRSLLSARSLSESSGIRVESAWRLGWDEADAPARLDRFDDVALHLAVDVWAEARAAG